MCTTCLGARGLCLLTALWCAAAVDDVDACAVKHFNPTVGLGIVRASRDTHRMVWLALSHITALGETEEPCALRVVHVAGTIRSCQIHALRTMVQQVEKVGSHHQRSCTHRHRHTLIHTHTHLCSLFSESIPGFLWELDRQCLGSLWERVSCPTVSWICLGCFVFFSVDLGGRLVLFSELWSPWCMCAGRHVVPGRAVLSCACVLSVCVPLAVVMVLPGLGGKWSCWGPQGEDITCQAGSTCH